MCLVYILTQILFRPSLNSPSVQLLKLELSVIIFNKIILTNSKKRGMVSLVLITAGILVQLAKKKSLFCGNRLAIVFRIIKVQDGKF
jgi:hypothetical protein